MVKSCLNYTGGKYELLPQILPLFSIEGRIFVDLFGGGFNVGVNTDAECVIYNDVCAPVVDVLSNFYENNVDDINKLILNTVAAYGLKGEKAEDEYYELMRSYNRKPDWVKFYTLITSSFNNFIRFNKQGSFNMSYGKRYYNEQLELKLKLFIDTMHKKDINFYNKTFSDWKFAKDFFVYCDPPYLGANAAYNNADRWSLKHERILLAYLDYVNNFGCRFALSNNLKYDNPILHEWMKKYNVYYLDKDYSNCNFCKLDYRQDLEVLITNY